MKFKLSIAIIILIQLTACGQVMNKNKNTADKKVNMAENYIRGWNILSNNIGMASRAIDACPDYEINHLQLSHDLMMDLKDVRENPRKLMNTRKLIKDAHELGINNVFIWDHALYSLDYYPDKFKNKDGLINLDNPGFWKWIKDDYRSMLDSVPGISGIVLTFVETGAQVEEQFSEVLKTESEKLASLVDSVASVIIDERGLELYIRTFTHAPKALGFMIGCVNLVKHPDVKVMTKEVPHDFFLPHPVSDFIYKFDKEMLIEFDLGHEYNGQGVVASILPETTIERWKYFARHPNVMGYVARTDRFGSTQNVGRATEVNMYALKRIAEDTTLTADVIVEEFIEKRYGQKAVPLLKDVFLESDEIIASMFYTLGIQIGKHSCMQLENQNSYSGHVSGVWIDPPTIKIGHNVNKTFHFWSDVIEHLTPPRFKVGQFIDENGNTHWSQIEQRLNYVIENGWVTPGEKINTEYLEYIVTEKRFCESKAAWALEKVREAGKVIDSTENYNELLYLYERTLLTAKLYECTFAAYFGFRYYLTNPHNDDVNKLIQSSLEKMEKTCEEILAYQHNDINGHFKWKKDVKYVQEQIFKPITEGYQYADFKKFPYKKVE
ncbi:hypothetical protein SAMN05444274_101609 [Mariniphaga anaerophila]|uniref:Glycosyl hydrolase family 115 n=1 Tax=Mariniphaga anaerophila TaxID=1484053 RepID=A0A1M4U904_9BACT|nr:hypothetical protein [Mariniphaga anaerophila]SHE53043.1 hypothetical protein SAMN05444274_101609 [Mariniphaga anaerophila]